VAVRTRGATWYPADEPDHPAVLEDRRRHVLGAS
jgi:hypothetical protein